MIPNGVLSRNDIVSGVPPGAWVNIFAGGNIFVYCHSLKTNFLTFNP